MANDPQPGIVPWFGGGGVSACPVCDGEGRVYRMTPAYEITVAQSSGSFSWTGPSHEWRRCIPCGGKGLIPPPLLPDDDTAVERLKAAGFEPDFNVCARCHHHGSRHDLNNRCMDCIEQVDDYFTAMTEDEKWAWGIAALHEGGQQ